MTLKVRATLSCAVLGLLLSTINTSAVAAVAVPYPTGDSFKKITSAPTDTSSKEDDAIVDESGHLVEAGPAARRGDVEVLPAPGASELSRGHAPASVEPASVKAPAVKVETKPAPKQEPTTPVVEAAPAKAEAAAEPVHEAKPAANPEAKLAAEQSLKWLTNGNTRFIKKANRADGRSPADRQRLVGGATPHAIILSCSDSRVPPELIFDQALGEIVTIRVAGEALDSSVIASIEAELHGKGPKLLVVLGHTNCSAVDAAVHYKEGQSAGSEFLDKAINEIRPHLKTAKTDHPSQDLAVESTLVADGTARELVKRSELIRHKVETGELVIKTALYRLDSGKVTFY